MFWAETTWSPGLVGQAPAGPSLCFLRYSRLDPRFVCGRRLSSVHWTEQDIMKNLRSLPSNNVTIFVNRRNRLTLHTPPTRGPKSVEILGGAKQHRKNQSGSASE
ncbi:hypothetical protein RRG08_025617 [Elysia crispata]|uniref:Uncharacterized protein n=1 Tax=Elysia crispata TaxID=231223 RepID=A0AAE1CXV1_9GAST|nr:hypothetical protein RRG08_025617 [Elysia crispata]